MFRQLPRKVPRAAVFRLPSRAIASPPPSPLAALAKRVEAGTTVLVDVREPAEWKTGVAAPARLLSLGQLQAGSDAWKKLLEENKDREMAFYCAAGARSGAVAEYLKGRGFRTENAGGFLDWRDAGLPVRMPTEEEIKGG
ncbi:Rhodanese-like domain-containing protein [Hyaloraphidium curvatum]|nr:Rhodanese-like domain-containing protein [Hyaloraphidium curvatum]